MHILVLPSSYPSTISPVAGSFVKEQVHALNENDYQVGVIHTELVSIRKFKLSASKINHFQTESYCENGVNVLRFGGWSLPKLRKVNFYIFRIMTNILVKRYIACFGVPDVIHAHGFIWAGISAIALREKYNIPLVVTEHSSAFERKLLSRWETWQVSCTANKVDRVIAVSQFLADSMKNQGVKNSIEIIPNVVDTRFFHLPTNTKPKKFTFLAIALLTQNKRIDVSLKAFAQSFKGNSKIRMEIGGDGPERAGLESLVCQLGIEKQVVFLGVLSKADVRRAMWRANIFVLSSHVETFGVVLIEAMATGLPVISTKCGGPEDLLPEHLGCSLVKSASVNSLATAMMQAFESNICNENELRNYAHNNFGKEALTQSLDIIYKGVVAKCY